MAQQPRKRPPQRKRGGGGGKAKPVDIWRPVPPLPDPEPIVPATDPTALLRSIGAPPLRARSDMAEAYLVAVAERAAGLATALAAAANLLALPADDDRRRLTLICFCVRPAPHGGGRRTQNAGHTTVRVTSTLPRVAFE